MKAIIFALALISTLALAQESTTQIDTVQTPYTSKTLLPFFGAGAGFTSYDVQKEKQGAPANLRLLLSKYFNDSRWVGDAGLGLQNHKFTGDNKTRDNSVSAIGELAARFQLNDNWQLGPSAIALLGNGEDYGSANSNITPYVGAQLIREWTADSYIFRAGGKLMADVNIPDTTATMALVEFQMSFGGTQVAQAQPASQDVVIQIPEVKPSPILDTPRYRFETGEYRVRNLDKTKLAKLAILLSKETDLFNSIKVSGHADERGGDRINNPLSVNRAIAVASLLKKGGIPATKVTIEGKGSHTPIDARSNDEAWTKNRRVELIIQGVKDTNKMAEILTTIE